MVTDLGTPIDCEPAGDKDGSKDDPTKLDRFDFADCFHLFCSFWLLTFGFVVPKKRKDDYEDGNYLRSHFKGIQETVFCFFLTHSPLIRQ